MEGSPRINKKMILSKRRFIRNFSFYTFEFESTFRRKILNFCKIRKNIAILDFEMLRDFQLKKLW